MEKIFKKFVFALISTAIFSALPVHAKSDSLSFDNGILPALKEKAKAENKKILVVFSGIEWCQPCRIFEANVLKNNKFKSFAKKNLIILDVDKKMDGSVEFTLNGKKMRLRNIDLQSEASALDKKFSVRGVPTAVLLGENLDALMTHVGCNISADEFIDKIKTASIQVSESKKE